MIATGMQEPAFGRSGFVAIAALLVVWEILGRLQLSIFVPPATTVAEAWWRLAAAGTLTSAGASSLLSLAKGFVELWGLPSKIAAKRDLRLSP